MATPEIKQRVDAAIAFAIREWNVPEHLYKKETPVEKPAETLLSSDYRHIVMSARQSVATGYGMMRYLSKDQKSRLASFLHSPLKTSDAVATDTPAPSIKPNPDYFTSKDKSVPTSRSILNQSLNEVVFTCIPPSCQGDYRTHFHDHPSAVQALQVSVNNLDNKNSLHVALAVVCIRATSDGDFACNYDPHRKFPSEISNVLWTFLIKFAYKALDSDADKVVNWESPYQSPIILPKNFAPLTKDDCELLQLCGIDQTTKG